MRLYFAPNTSAIGIRILLEEIGKPFEATPIDLAAKEQYSPVFMAINPKSKVPVLLRDDGSVLTEFGAIARWLCRTNPSADLLPPDVEGEARAGELLDYIVATVHMRGFSRLIAPANFGASGLKEIKAAGRKIVDRGFELIGSALGDRPYVVGTYSYADPALFYVERWAAHNNVTMPAACANHYSRMLHRPAVQRALAAEQRL
jgi:glutathione S-transferase